MNISRDLFRAHLAADPASVGPQILERFERERRSMLSLELSIEQAPAVQSMQFSAKTNAAAFLYCFLEDDDSGQVRTVFPSASQRSNRVTAEKTLNLPTSTWRLITTNAGRAQTLGCFAVAQSVGAPLLNVVTSPAGTVVPRVTGMDGLTTQFRSAGGRVATAYLTFAAQPSNAPRNASAR